MRTEMHSHTFDTHEYIKELIKVGIKEPQAEAIVKGILKSRDHDFSKLATKEQVAIIEHALAVIQKDMGKCATKEQLEHLEEKLITKIDSLEEKVDAIIKDMEKFATKEQVTHLEEKFSIKLDAAEKKLVEKIESVANASQTGLIKWIVPILISNLIAVLGIVLTAIKVFGIH
jgi:hypothetical protein